MFKELERTVRSAEDERLGRIAVYATECAIKSRYWLSKAKAQLNHNMALANDKLAALYEQQCIEWASKLVSALEKRVL